MIYKPEEPAALPNNISTRFAAFRQFVYNTDRRRRLLLFGSLIAFSIVVLLATLARVYQTLPIDIATTLELQEYQSRILDSFMYAVSIFGYSPYASIIVGVVTTLICLLIGLKDGGYLLLITIIQGLLNAGIKLLIGHPRPVSTLLDVVVPERGNSFPSGHVMFYTVFFGFLAFLVWTHVKVRLLRWLILVILLGLIALVGPSRIFLGSHWLSDVIAAYLLGTIILAFSIEIYLQNVASRNTKSVG